MAEALALAKQDNPETVGDPADYVIISRKRTYRCPSDFADGLASKYNGIDTSPLDTDLATLQEIRKVCYTHVTQEDMRKGERPQNLEDTKQSASQVSGQERPPLLKHLFGCFDGIAHVQSVARS
jgi:hypothetical protein